MTVHHGHDVVIDTAGGKGGGAGRFRSELDAYLGRRALAGIVTIGADEYVTPSWLARREWHSRGASRAVAANNVSYAFAGDERWVLTRNANHFLTDSEWRSVAHLHPAKFRRQIHIVRAMLHRADRIVAPTSEMAERVASVLPRARDRITVRFHPFSTRQISRVPEPLILCPIVDSPFKQMSSAMADLADAIQGLPTVRVIWTSESNLAPAALRNNPAFDLVGTIDREELDDLYARAAAIYYPTEFESFGYPLAEARALGIPILARDKDRTREVAGDALFGFTPEDPDSLRDAVEAALVANVQPDPGPFDPDSYFDWMLG